MDIELEIFDKTDYHGWYSKYFWCGYSRIPYYNFYFARAIRIIGKYFGNNSLCNSDFHKGVSYIAKELCLTKTEIKVLRKKLLVFKNLKVGYEFKVPKKIVRILVFIIIKLKEIKDMYSVMTFSINEFGKKYRDILIPKQYAAIRIAAEESHNDDLFKIVGELNSLVDVIEENKNV